MSKQTCVPYGERLLVRPIDFNWQNRPKDSIIQIPESAKEKSNFAEIIAVGTAVNKETFPVGLTIIVNKYSGNNVTICGEQYSIISLDEVLAILDETPQADAVNFN